MSSDKKSGESSEGLEDQLSDFTSSITETDHESELEVNPTERLSRLLGARSLEQHREGHVLLRLAAGSLGESLAEALQTSVYEPVRRTDDLPVPFITGPYDLDFLKDLAEKGFFRPQDAILMSYGRWRSVKDMFSDFMEPSHTDEITNTMTATATETNVQDEETGTASGTLELDAVDDETPTPVPRENFEDEPASFSEVQPLDLEEPEEEKLSVPPRASPELKKTERGKPAIPTVRARPHAAPSSVRSSGRQLGGAAATQSPSVGEKNLSLPSTKTWPGLLAAVGVLLIVGWYFLGRRSQMAMRGEKQENVEATSQWHVPVDWPLHLRPRSIESLYQDDSGLIRKIRPILRAYEGGTLVLTSDNERTLKEVSDPASASFEARRLAANQLAVYYIAASRIQEAREVLLPIVNSGGADATTYLNMALLQLTVGEYAEARDSATAALRLVAPADAWIAHSVVGLVEGYRGRLGEAELNFKDALRRSLNNPFVYGLYVRTLLEVSGSEDKIAALIKEALWADPDRLMDSPIRAPLAGHVLTSFALEGLVRGAEFKESRLSPGRLAFVRWLEARYRRNPLSQPTARVQDILAGEDNPQSQLLYAYLLTDQKRWDDAAEVMSRVMALLQTSDDLKSSFPWSFAGDVQYARRNVSQAIVYYNSALSRNPQDLAAVLGMALAFRDGGEFRSAEQKLAEALSLDPFFLPALLRISRLEWHAIRGSQ